MPVKRKLDFPFLVPAILCNLAFLMGTIPAWLCLNGAVFAWGSVALFLISLLAHLYIILQWHKYRDSSPLGYAIVQPALHAVMLVYSLAVGSTSRCVPPPPDRSTIQQIERLPRDHGLSEVISES